MKQKRFTTNRKLMASASMLLVSIMTLSSATYAWFTMNKEVSVTGMEVKAKAYNGLVISGDNKSTWKTDWDVAMTTGVELYPTSTNGAASPSWAVAYSKDFDDANKNQTGSGATYADITPSYTTSGTTGDTFTNGVDGIGQTGDPSRSYVLKKTFWIKSTGESAWTSSINVKSVTAEVADTSGSGTANLNKALRVLVVSGSDAFVYAPVTGYDNAINFKGTTAVTLVPATTSSNLASVTSIPNTDAGAIRVDMYIYYEGEDQNCKSSNIAAISVDTLKVSAEFEATQTP